MCVAYLARCYTSRRSTQRNIPDALGCRCNNAVHHCKIFYEERVHKYGFADPFIIHPSLMDMVLHYRETSLEEHNQMLNETLKFPAFYNPQP